MRKLIERLRKQLPELLTLPQYRETKGCCTSTAYTDLRTTPGLGVKVGNHTFFVRDVMLDQMARPPQPWTPQKDRPPKEVTRPTRRRAKQAVAARRKRDEVLA